MITYLDLDEVIVNTYDSICKFKGLQNPYLRFENLGKYSIHSLVGQTHEEFWLSLTREHWANMDKMPWADQLVNTLNDLENEGFFTWRFLTAPIQDGDCFAGKFDWVKKHYPQFTQKLIIGRNKQDIVGRGDLLIDDSPVNLEYFIKTDKIGSFYYFPSVGNERFDKIPKNQKEIDKLIQHIVFELVKKSAK